MTPVFNPDLHVATAQVYPPAGHVETLTLPANRDGLLLHPQSVANHAMAAIPAALAMARRIVPFATVIFTPGLFQDADESDMGDACHWSMDGKLYAKLAGCSINRTPTIYVTVLSNPSYIAATVAHEAWHCLETHALPQHWIELIDSLIEDSQFTIPQAYYTKPCERRARAFEVWAMRFVEGLPGKLHPTQIDDIFARAWCGDLAADAAEYWQEVGEKAA